MPGEPRSISSRRTRTDLTDGEFRVIERSCSAARRRSPNSAVFSVMWSEHCSYKSSRRHLQDAAVARRLVVQAGPGENAGAINVGDGWVAVFKIESHNHPSFVEPYQGAATGVGGILRDIFTMGARPIASMDSLKFGSFDHPRTRYLLGGVVGGIGGYGNCVGVPTVAGESDVRRGLQREHPGQRVLPRPRAQGRAAERARAAASETRSSMSDRRPAATGFMARACWRRPSSTPAAKRSGRPFRSAIRSPKRLLIEACLEAMKTGAIVAIQDMGAAGLTSSSSEMAARGGLGIEIDLDQVPLREPGLTPYEILLSESQERMLIVAERGRESRTRSDFREVGSARGRRSAGLPTTRRWRVTLGGKRRRRYSGARARPTKRRSTIVRRTAAAASRLTAAPATTTAASGAPRGAARPARQSQRRLEAMDLPAIRFDRAGQYGRRTGQRRGACCESRGRGADSR